MNLGGRKLVAGSLSCKVIVLRPRGTEFLRGYSAEYPSASFQGGREPKSNL